MLSCIQTLAVLASAQDCEAHHVLRRNTRGAVICSRLGKPWQRGNSGGVAQLYTGDAQVLAPGMETVAGSASIQSFWTSVMKMGVKQVSLNTREVEGALPDVSLGTICSHSRKRLKCRRLGCGVGCALS